MNFQAIVFDYGNVLAGVPGSGWADDIKTAIGVAEDDYNHAFFKYNHLAHSGETDWDELWRSVLTDLGKLDKLPEVIRIKNDYEDSLSNLNQPVVDLAVRLKEEGYKIGVISNTSPEGAKRIHKKLAPYPFDIVHCSAETGKVKPSPAAFVEMATALGIDIHTMVFIDDSKRNLSTAAETGYTPILFNSYHDLVDMLASLDIQV
jgi:HAD superfamily hydrolase (TIGR01509 family)